MVECPPVVAPSFPGQCRLLAGVRLFGEIGLGERVAQRDQRLTHLGRHRRLQRPSDAELLIDPGQLAVHERAGRSQLVQVVLLEMILSARSVQEALHVLEPVPDSADHLTDWGARAWPSVKLADEWLDPREAERYVRIGAR